MVHQDEYDQEGREQHVLNAFPSARIEQARCLKGVGTKTVLLTSAESLTLAGDVCRHDAILRTLNGIKWYRNDDMSMDEFFAPVMLSRLQRAKHHCAKFLQNGVETAVLCNGIMTFVDTFAAGSAADFCLPQKRTKRRRISTRNERKELSTVALPTSGPLSEELRRAFTSFGQCEVHVSVSDGLGLPGLWEIRTAEVQQRDVPISAPSLGSDREISGSIQNLSEEVGLALLSEPASLKGVPSIIHAEGFFCAGLLLKVLEEVGILCQEGEGKGEEGGGEGGGGGDPWGFLECVGGGAVPWQGAEGSVMSPLDLGTAQRFFVKGCTVFSHTLRSTGDLC